jgi:hypothetical protein
MFSNSFGVGTNTGFSDTTTQDDKGNKQTNTDTKVNSSTLNFATNMGYSSSKVYSTTGQGTITLKDKDNSDDITNLNRDTDNQINKLYEGSVGTSVDASIDHRLFSEEGRKEIAKDFFVTSNLANSIFDAITKESQSMGDTARNYMISEAVQDIAANNPGLFKEYNNPDISIERKNELDTQITNMILTEAGYQPVTVLGMNNDIKNKDGNSVQGYYDPDSNTIFLNNGLYQTSNLADALIASTIVIPEGVVAGNTIKTAKTGEKIVEEVIKRGDDVIEWAGNSVNHSLINESASKGIKVTPENVIATTRSANGQIIFLETGNSKAGLQHIVAEHKNDFANIGVSETQIPKVLMRAINENKAIGYQGVGIGRPIYETTINGQKQKIAITIDDNGYVVGANPVGSIK